MKRLAACLCILLLQAGCLAGEPQPAEPTKDTLADHTRCDYRDRNNASLDCSKAAQELPVSATLDGNLWTCTEELRVQEGTFLAIYYDPVGKRNALWFNFTPDERRDGPGTWFASVYLEGGAFYSFTSATSTGYVILPTILPDGELDLAYNRVVASLGGGLEGGQLRLVWMREPVRPGTAGTDGTWTGVINAVRVNGTDFWFFDRANGRGGNGHWEGHDYTLTVDWTHHSRGWGNVRPTFLAPTGGIWTPAAATEYCD